MNLWTTENFRIKAIPSFKTSVINYKAIQHHSKGFSIRPLWKPRKSKNNVLV